MATTTQSHTIQPKRTFKDSLFRDLFGNSSRKDYALSLYNALTGSAHTDPTRLELTTIEGVLYMGYKNDVSFVLDGDMMLWEHQSTVNPNMPLRGLLYFAQLYRRYLDSTKQSELSTHLVPLPSPRYFVFYNGLEKRPDREELALSDAFVNGSGSIEVTATVLNVNEGNNRAIMDACDELRGYAHLTALYRKLVQQMEPREAMDAAVATCMSDGFLVDYLALRRSEVIDMLLAEWKEEEYREMLRREAKEDGYDEGYGEGKKAGYSAGEKAGSSSGEQKGRDMTQREFLDRAAAAVRSGVMSASTAASVFGFSEERIAAAL